MPNTLAPVFPFDATGMAVTNLITAEHQILTSANGIDFHFLVPISGPYFENSLVVTITDPVTNVVSTLSPGIDYYPTHWFISASRACAGNIYGSVTFLDLTLAGIITFKYQTIGGGWTINSSEVATILADTLHNPRITAWEEVVLSYQVVNAPSFVAGQFYLISEIGTTDFTLIGAPSNTSGIQFKATGPGAGTGNAVSMSFPPTPHQWNVVDMVGMSSVVDAINNVANSIMASIPANLAVSTSVTTITTLINAETTRATLAETSLTNLIAVEVSRAQAAETSISANTVAAINTETTRAQNAESTLTSNLANEITNRTNAVNTLTNNLTTEVTNRSAAIAAEASTRDTADTANATATSAETTRATAAEVLLTTNLAAEATNRINAIAAEAARAIAAELVLTTASSNVQAEDEAYFIGNS